jgi:hypothetical protein
MVNEVPSIVDAVLMDNSVSIRFSDGKCSRYPAFFLFASAGLADIFIEEEAGRRYSMVPRQADSSSSTFDNSLQYQEDELSFCDGPIGEDCAPDPQEGRRE